MAPSAGFGQPESLNGHRPHMNPAVPASKATRYLCAAAHLRRSLLPDHIIDPDTMIARSPEPVGRRYALYALFGLHGTMPVPWVDMPEIRRHCRAALRQTLARDSLVIAALLTAGFLALWGTIVVLGLIAVAIVLAGRVRLSSLVFLGGAIGLALAVISTGPVGVSFLAIPLIALVLCFLAYIADGLWGLRRVRTLLRQSPGPSVNGPVPTPSSEPTWHTPDTEPSALASDTREDSSDARPPHDRVRVFYEKDRILGTGAPMIPVTLTVPVDKPLDHQEKPESFKASDLLAYIASNIEAQGEVDSGEYNDSLSGTLAPNGREHQLSTDEFTYGLPRLRVSEVIAATKRNACDLIVMASHGRRGVSALMLGSETVKVLTHSTVPVLVYRHDRSQPSDADILSMADRSPSAHPERHYVLASTMSWDGYLVVSIYLSAALQGHYLRVIIRPYILAPIAPDLRAADDIAARHLLIQVGAVMAGTTRRLLATAASLHGLGHARDATSARKLGDVKFRSVRERYSQNYTDMHQSEDALRITQVIEMKALGMTREFLRDHNIDTAEYERQIQVFMDSRVQVTGDIYGTVNAATGPGSTATTNVNNGSQKREQK